MGRKPSLLLQIARHHWESRDTLEACDEAAKLVREAAAAEPDLQTAQDVLQSIESRRRSLNASLAR